MISKHTVTEREMVYRKLQQIDIELPLRIVHFSVKIANELKLKWTGNKMLFKPSIRKSVKRNCCEVDKKITLCEHGHVAVIG
jgi:hypothetical protein